MAILGAKVERNNPDEREAQKRNKLDMERRRAMVLGQFSFLDETDKEVLDDTTALFSAAKKWKTSNNDEGKKKTYIRYEAAPQTVDGEEKAIVNLRRSLGFDDIVLPKCGDTFVVVWVTSKGQVVIDRDVMLLNMKEVITTKVDQPDIPGPQDPKFAFIERRNDDDSGGSFDLDLFWSVGFLFKHFKSCGLMKWDREMVHLRREVRDDATEVLKRVREGGKRRRRSGGKYQGKLTGWKGTYGFIQCTTGEHANKTIFLHHTDIVSPYLHLVRGLEFRFDIVKEEEDSQKLRAVKAQPCLCKYTCTVHESSEQADKPSTPKGRRRRRSSKSSRSTKQNSNSDDAANGSDAATPEIGAGDSDRRQRDKGRRRFNRRPRKSDVESESLPFHVSI